jgi:hypothetical protein
MYVRLGFCKETRNPFRVRTYYLVVFHNTYYSTGLEVNALKTFAKWKAKREDEKN